MRATLCVFLAACAGSRPNLTPSSQPAYEAVSAGDVVAEDGFFLSIPGAKAKLLDDRMHDLDMEQKLAESDARRKAAEKIAEKNAFCAMYCLELGAGGVVLVEMIAVGFYAALKK